MNELIFYFHMYYYNIISAVTNWILHTDNSSMYRSGLQKNRRKQELVSVPEIFMLTELRITKINSIVHSNDKVILQNVKKRFLAVLSRNHVAFLMNCRAFDFFPNWQKSVETVTWQIDVYFVDHKL